MMEPDADGRLRLDTEGDGQDPEDWLSLLEPVLASVQWGLAP
ncbi:MAG: hypothetical protein R3343_08295 [Nitriliruptorales bacterium]|nr:hypothetical protein [Nitriliruptorales bacterium]